MKCRSKISCEAGLGLIEVLAMTSILVFIALVYASMMNQQLKDLRRASQKQETSRLHQMLLTQFSDPATCKLNFSGQKFVSVPPPKATLSTVKAKGNALVVGAGATVAAMASEGQPLTKDVSSPHVYTIRVTNLVRTAPSAYDGELVVTFLNDSEATGHKGAVTLRPISIPMSFVTSGAGATKTITDCVGGVPETTQQTCKLRTRYSTGDAMNTVCCLSNETIISWAAPLDPKSKAFEWQVANQTCGNIRDIKGGNPVQLLCCK